MDVAQLLDLEEIRQLTYGYSWGIDTQDLDRVVGVFTETALFDETALGIPACKGQDEIRSTFGAILPAITGGSQHPITNHMVEFTDADNASGVCYVLGSGIAPDGALLQAHVAYEDTYLRTDSGWRISSRRVRVLMPPRMEGYQGPRTDAGGES